MIYNDKEWNTKYKIIMTEYEPEYYIKYQIERADRTNPNRL